MFDKGGMSFVERAFVVVANFTRNKNILSCNCYHCKKIKLSLKSKFKQILCQSSSVCISRVAQGFCHIDNSLVLNFCGVFSLFKYWLKKPEQSKSNEKVTANTSSASEWIFALSTECDIKQMPGLYMQMLNCYYIIKVISRKHISAAIQNYSSVINVRNVQKTICAAHGEVNSKPFYWQSEFTHFAFYDKAK